MRRISRPQRAIDPAAPLPSILRHQLPPTSCLRVTTPYSHLRTTSASFSTTPTLSFLLGKQDKKKHQAFVRRWQKRLLGDSEPIGAHVDPYDPTSPVRIAPEEQGEEVEVLEEEQSEGTLGETDLPLYDEAQYSDTLRRVGGKEWLAQVEEVKLAKEFEKLTLRTYTPLDKKMAKEVEDWTGTPYTLRDENLYMADAFEGMTAKPYTDWSFGRRTRVRSPEALRQNFHRAVVEIHALKSAGENPDISRLANRGVYNAPKWIKDVKLQRSKEQFELSLPGTQTLETLLDEMKHVPVYDPMQATLASQHALEDNMLNDLDEVMEEEMAEELVAEQPAPVMDPDTPAFRRAALVQQDPEKRFDFMSNRPIPRTPPAAPIVQPAETIKETVVVETKVKPVTENIAMVKETVVVEEAPSSVDADARTPASSTSEILEASKDGTFPHWASKSVKRATPAETEAKWRDVPLTDVDMKFALTKRMTQLTGLYITDPKLTSTTTLGELYHHFCVAAKPELDKVFKYVQVEGSKENQKAKETDGVATKQNKPRATVGELLKLGHVQVLSKRPTAKDERKKTGLHKAINRELKERGLVDHRPRARGVKGEQISWQNHPSATHKGKFKKRKLRTKEIDSREARRVQLGAVVPREAVHLLKERTERKRKELM